jgi:hypothetical protein
VIDIANQSVMLVIMSIDMCSRKEKEERYRNRLDVISTRLVLINFSLRL